MWRRCPIRTPEESRGIIWLPRWFPECLALPAAVAAQAAAEAEAEAVAEPAGEVVELPPLVLPGRKILLRFLLRLVSILPCLPQRAWILRR